jgi:hypothetical protein
VRSERDILTGLLLTSHLLRLTSYLSPSKDLASTGEDLVQRLAEIRGGFRHLASDLFGVFLKALLYLVLEELLEVAVAQALLPFAWVVDHHIGDEGPGQTLGFERRILGKEGIGRSSSCGGRRPGSRGTG